MLCHFCYVLFFWLRDNLFYLKACEGNKDGHQRTEYVKEAIGQVGQRAYAKHRGLSHAARVPWYQHGSNRYRVFYGAAQQPALESAALIKVLEQVACQDDRQILVGRTCVEEKTCAYR